MSLFYKKAACKSSIIKGLLYTPENCEECKKGMLSDWPWLSRVTSMALLCLWGRQSLEGMTSLGTFSETHAIWQGYVENPAAKDIVARKACTIALSKAQGSCHRTSNNQPYSQVWKSLTRAVLHSYVGLMSCEKVSVGGFSWVRKVWFTFAQWIFALNTFGESRKKEKLPIVSLLPGSHEHHASRNPQVLCQKQGGACTTYYLGVPEVQETG